MTWFLLLGWISLLVVSSIESFCDRRAGRESAGVGLDSYASGDHRGAFNERVDQR